MTSFLGTTSGVDFELRAGNQTVGTLQPYDVSTSRPRIVLGHGSNGMLSSGVGSTVGGGGTSGSPNRVANNFSTVGGGVGNRALNLNATVGGGASNLANGPSATVGGGFQNEARGEYSTAGRINSG